MSLINSSCISLGARGVRNGASLRFHKGISPAIRPVAPPPAEFILTPGGYKAKGGTAFHPLTKDDGIPRLRDDSP